MLTFYSLVGVAPASSSTVNQSGASEDMFLDRSAVLQATARENLFFDRSAGTSEDVFLDR
jgi:hypothetical protein